MKSILLTGGSGFIGRNIKESFLAKKYQIIAPKSSELNLISTEAVDEYFTNKNFDVVIHAAVKPCHRNAQDLTDLVYANLRIFQNLERHKDKYGKFINLGSGAIYDTTKNITNAIEEQRFANIGTKEHDFCKYIISKQIEHLDNFVDLYIFGIFGKYEDYSIRFISNAICKVLHNLPITLRQDRKFSYLYIDDLMPILEFFIENKITHHAYNIVPNQKTTLLDIAKFIIKVSKKNNAIKVGQEGLGLDYNGDNARIKNDFVDIKFTDIEKSIVLLYDYYKSAQCSLNRELLINDR